MKRLLFCLVLSCLRFCCSGQTVDVSGEVSTVKNYRWSLVALSAASTADVASSWGLYELNPVLGNGQFGSRQLAIKAGITAALVGAEALTVRKHPNLRKPFTIVNWTAAGVLSGVVGWNLSQR